MDIGIFFTGLLGALVGGAASFGVQIYVAKREKHARRIAAVSRIDAAFRGLLREGAARTETSPNSEKFFDAMVESRAAIMALRLVLKPRETQVADWLDGRRKHVTKMVAGDADRAVEAIEYIDKALRLLVEWVSQQRAVSSFVAAEDSTKKPSRTLRARLTETFRAWRR